MFLKEFFEKLILKKSAEDNKSMKKLPSMQGVNAYLIKITCLQNKKVVIKQDNLKLLSLKAPATIGSAVAQWLSGRVLDSRPRGRGFEPHRRHCVVSLSKNINPSLVLVQPRKICITERLLMGRQESNQTNKQNLQQFI